MHSFSDWTQGVISDSHMANVLYLLFISFLVFRPLKDFNTMCRPPPIHTLRTGQSHLSPFTHCRNTLWEQFGVKSLAL